MSPSRSDLARATTATSASLLTDIEHRLGETEAVLLAVAYGSRVHGWANKDSDLDLIVVSGPISLEDRQDLRQTILSIGHGHHITIGLSLYEQPILDSKVAATPGFWRLIGARGRVLKGSWDAVLPPEAAGDLTLPMDGRAAAALYAANKLTSARYQFEHLSRDKDRHESVLTLTQADPEVREILTRSALEHGVEDCYQAVLMAAQAVRIAQAGRKDRRSYGQVLSVAAHSVGVEASVVLRRLRPLSSDWHLDPEKGLGPDMLAEDEAEARDFVEACARHLKTLGVSIPDTRDTPQPG